MSEALARWDPAVLALCAFLLAALSFVALAALVGIRARRGARATGRRTAPLPRGGATEQAGRGTASRRRLGRQHRPRGHTYSFHERREAERYGELFWGASPPSTAHGQAGPSGEAVPAADPAEQLERLRAERLETASATERMRAALRAAGEHGYYAFDAVATDGAGMLDYLAIGPRGVWLILADHHRAFVERDGESGELLADGTPFEEDLDARLEELSRELGSTLLWAGEPVGSLICFTRATLRRDGENMDPEGTASVWDLAWTLSPVGSTAGPPVGPPAIPPEAARDLAARTREAYGRAPFVRPQGEEG
jgi:hypothetical protein